MDRKFKKNQKIPKNKKIKKSKKTKKLKKMKNPNFQKFFEILGIFWKFLRFFQKM